MAWMDPAVHVDMYNVHMYPHVHVDMYMYDAHVYRVNT